jgi:hypothetical protein
MHDQSFSTGMTRAAPDLKSGFGNRIPAGRSQVIGCGALAAVVEGQEQRALPGSGAASGHLDGAAAGFDAYQIAIGDFESSGVRWRQLNSRLRRRGVQFGRPAGLGPGVEVIHAPAGHQLHRVRVVRALCRWPLGPLLSSSSLDRIVTKSIASSQDASTSVVPFLIMGRVSRS